MKRWVKVLLSIIIIVSSILLYARFVSTKGFKVLEYKLVDAKLPNNFNGLKIVHFSDIHYGRTTNIESIKEVVKEINILKPDIVIFTGDLYENNLDILDKETKNIIAELGKINVTLGKYAITGDSDKKNYKNIMTEAGFTLIDDDSAYIYYNDITPIKITNNLENTDDMFTIGVIHEPDNIDNMNLDGFNVVLAGHSLNGQIRIPFYGGIIKKTGAKKYTDSYYELNNTKFYISNGLGTENFSFRFNNKPSINFYRLTNY